VKGYSAPPMTLGSAAAAHVRLIVWCRDCRHQVEPDPAEMAERYGAEMTVFRDLRRGLAPPRLGDPDRESPVKALLRERESINARHARKTRSGPI
jgi:hypothetical protein